jgi:hypothetical protein
VPSLKTLSFFLPSVLLTIPPQACGRKQSRPMTHSQLYIHLFIYSCLEILVFFSFGHYPHHHWDSEEFFYFWLPSFIVFFFDAFRGLLKLFLSSSQRELCSASSTTRKISWRKNSENDFCLCDFWEFGWYLSSLCEAGA